MLPILFGRNNLILAPKVISHLHKVANIGNIGRMVECIMGMQIVHYDTSVRIGHFAQKVENFAD